MANMSDMILEHTFDAYAKRMNKENGQKFVYIRDENDKLKNRVKRINLKEA